MAPKKFRNNYLFDYLRNILVEKSMDLFEKHLADDFEASYLPFMINSYLSMSPSLQVRQVIFDNQLEIDHLPTKKSHYLFFLKAIPRQRSAYIKFIK